jgi:putative RNA 2'-phosphotransferase
MTEADTLEHISKLLSLVLRHAPHTIGVQLDAQGWAVVDELLACVARHGRPITRAQLDAVVAASDKQRFAFSADGLRIRANQGHSLACVDLALAPAAPPALLYHGTTLRYLASIRGAGLRPGARHHVHLSREPATATIVGARHGKPVVLMVDAAAMVHAGHVFYLSANGVWLADEVPPAYITFPAAR